MKINVSTELGLLKCQVGDIIIPPGQLNAYFIYKSPTSEKYSLLNQNMTSFYTGEFTTLDGLVRDFARWGDKMRHYSKDEYELSLVRKEGK